MDNLEYAMKELDKIERDLTDMREEFDGLAINLTKTRHALEGKCSFLVFVYSNPDVASISEIHFFHLCNKPYGHEGEHAAKNFEKKSALNVDYEYYITHEKELMKKYPGRFVLIKDRQVHGDFPSFNEAHKKALELFGNVDVLIQEMTENKPVNIVLSG